MILLYRSKDKITCCVLLLLESISVHMNCDESKYAVGSSFWTASFFFFFFFTKCSILKLWRDNTFTLYIVVPHDPARHHYKYSPYIAATS